jgi:hypothetical protein
MGNISGQFKALDLATVKALSLAARSGRQIEAHEVADIEKAAALDGHLSAGEQDLIRFLREGTLQGKAITQFELFDMDSTTADGVVDLSLTPSGGVHLAKSAAAPTNSSTDSALPADFKQALAPLSAPEQQALSALLAAVSPTQQQALLRAMGNRSAQALQTFAQRFLALPPQEQKIALQVAEKLMQKPESPDLRAQLQAQMSQVPPATPPLRTGEALGRSLNALGLYLPNLKPNSPASEDASSRMRSSYLSYTPERMSPDEPHHDYVRGAINLAHKKGYQIVLQVPQNADLTAIKRDLMAKTGISDPAEFDRIVSFKATARNGYDWGEDGKIMLNDNRTVLLLPKDKNQKESDVVRSLGELRTFVRSKIPLQVGSAGFLREGYHTLTPQDPSIQGNVNNIERNFNNSQVQDQQTQKPRQRQESERQDTGAQFADSNAMTARQTRTYNEGGNMLNGTLPNGQPFAVIGRDGVIASTFLLEKKARQNPKSVPEYGSKQIAERRQALGWNQQPLPVEKEQELKQTLARLQKVRPTATREEAKNFLAKMDITKDIFAQDLGIARQNLVFVSQPGFHLDMQMRPLAPGQILLNDQTQTIAMLEKAKEKAQPGSWEERELNQMLANARQQEALMQPLTEEIASQLAAAGLQVVRAPGRMESRMEKFIVEQDSELGKALGLTEDTTFDPQALEQRLGDLYEKDFQAKKTPFKTAAEARQAAQRDAQEMFIRPVNFMNAVPGSNSGSNTQYYATNYTSIAPLREQFSAFMRAQGIDQVEWIGDGQKPDHPWRRSPAEISLSRAGGLDCREVHANLQPTSLVG